MIRTPSKQWGVCDKDVIHSFAIDWTFVNNVECVPPEKGMCLSIIKMATDELTFSKDTFTWLAALLQTDQNVEWREFLLAKGDLSITSC